MLLAALAGCGPGEGHRPAAARAERVQRLAAADDPGRAVADRPSHPVPERPGLRPSPRREIDCRQVRCVALTFDDGPGGPTGRLLDVLAEHGVRVTFFVVGRRVTARSAPLLRRMVADGHELGNHSWNHRSLPRLPAVRVRRQLARTQRVVAEATGVVMHLMRPPYGATDAKVTAAARRAGLARILWDVDTLDWRDRKPAVIRRRALRARPGSIVLLHDIHPTTVQAVPKLVRALHARGFTLVTVSELFADRVLVPGGRYHRR